MPRLSIVTLGILVAPWAFAEQPSVEVSRFATMKSQAVSKYALGEFLQKYVGDCGSVPNRECEQRATATRAALTGTKFFVSLDDSGQGLIQARTFDDATRSFVMTLTPFFAASEYAVTQGAPKALDRDGNPLVQLLTLHGTAPDGWSMSTLRRQLDSGGLRLEVVFTPVGLWQLKTKGGKVLRGVKARIDGLAIFVRRSGEEIATWIP